MSNSRSVSKNIFYLGLLQFTNFLVPIIVIPILLSRIGLDNYGVIVLAQAIMTVFVAVTDFGFNLTGTRLISQNRENRDVKEQLVFNILIVKTIFLIGGFIVLCFLTYLLPTWKQHTLVILSSYLIVVGHTYFPVWYYQGMQRMSFVTVFNFISRIIYVSALLILVKEPAQLLLVNVINGFSWIVVSVISLTMIFRSYRFRLKLSSLSELYGFARSNMPIFLSNITGTTYRNGSIILAGFLLDQSMLGIFGILDKVIQLMVNSFAVIFRSIYPAACDLIDKNTVELKKLLLNIFKRLSIPVITGVIILYVFGGSMIALVSEDINVIDFRRYMELLAFLPIVYFLNVPISVLILASNRKKNYMYYNLYALVCLVIAAPILSQYFEIEGVIFAIILAECAMLVYGIVVLKQYIKPFKMIFSPKES